MTIVSSQVIRFARRIAYRTLRSLAILAAAVVSLPLLMFVALRARGSQTTLVWGCTPLVNNKYWARAFSERGHRTLTLMTHQYPAFDKADFDLYFEDVLPGFFARRKALNFVGPYFAAARILREAQVFHISFNGGALSGTLLESFEPWLLRTAGVKTVVSVYGGDAYMPSKVVNASLRHALVADYPHLVQTESWTARRVARWSYHGDCVLTGVLLDGMPRWDSPIVSQLTIDTESWTARETWSDADGVSGVVRILHTPNHRSFKGTEFIIAAVDRLKSSGLKVELVLLEDVKNTEVRERMKTCDILVEQLIFTGYALSALEGMCTGLCVIANLEDEKVCSLFRNYSFLEECPIVSAGPETVADVLEDLVRNPELRKQLGVAARAYVEKYHSYHAARHFYSAVHDKILGRASVDLVNFYHPLKSAWMKSQPRIEHPLTKNRLPAGH